MHQVKIGHYVVGTAGLALLRTWLVGTHAAADARAADVAALLRRLDAPPLSAAFDAPELDVDEGYARWAGSYDAMPNPLIGLEQPVVHGLLADVPAGDALDAACGTGRHAAFLVAHGHRTVGVDASPAMLAVAQAAVPSAEFRRGDLTALPVADASADVVVCALALTHVANVGPPLAELARVVRPGGRIVVSDFAPAMGLLGGTALFFDRDGRAGYVRSYAHTHAAYLQAFRAAGLVVRDCIEPALGDDDVAVLSAGLSAEAPEAFGAAWCGIPAAIVWDLSRPANAG